MKGISSIFLLLIISACGSGTGNVSDADIAANVGRVIGAINGVMDEHSNTSFSTFDIGLTEFCLDRAVREDCFSGSKTVTYNECIITEGLTLEGTVSLNYSENDCSLNSFNSTVTRTPNLTKRGVNGAVTRVFSTSEEDYRGEEIGGGSRAIAGSGSLYTLKILGKHIEQETSSGFQGFDIAMRTLSDISITGTSNMEISGRKLDGGELEVSHSLREYTANYSFSDVTYNGSCCHPISGEMNITFDGDASGSAIIQFNGSCGAVTMTKDSRNVPVFIEDCNY